MFKSLNTLRKINKLSQRYEDVIASIALISIALLVIMVAGFGLESMMPKDPILVDPILAAKFIASSAVHPKPHDKLLFPLFVFVTVGILGFSAIIWRYLRKCLIDSRVLFAMCCLLSAMIACWLGHGSGLAKLFISPYFIVSITCLLAGFIIALTSTNVSVSTRLFFRQQVTVVIFLTIAVLTLFSHIFSVSTVAYQPHFTSHFEAAIYSIIHIAGGGTCLADVPAQYGCYGEFIAPLISVTGASTFAITTILTTLLVIAILPIIVFASTLIRSTVLLVSSMLCITMLMNIVYFVGSPDNYFQYNPIRLLFPSLSLLGVVIVQKTPSFRNLFLLGVFAGVAMAWNLDTGIAVVAALSFFVAVGHFTEQKWLLKNWKITFKRLFFFESGVIIFLLAFLLYLEMKSGWRVNLSQAFAYQQMFYIAGWGSLSRPPFPDYWTISTLVISLVLLAAMTRFSQFASPRLDWERATYLAVLAIGLALYYMVRSHWLVLRLVAWPQVILFFFCADCALREMSSVMKKAAVISVLFSIPIIICYFYFPTLYSVVTTFRSSAHDNQVQQDIAFIKSHTKFGEKIGILSENQATLHGGSGTWPALAGPSFAEMQLIHDRQAMEVNIAQAGPHKIFINFAGIPLAVDSEFMRTSHYLLVDSGPDNRILYFVRRD